MIKSLARKATLFLLDNKSIKLNQYELYLYGFETLIALIINILVILLVSIILSKFIETVLFLLVYCTIRQFTGGYHAENHFKCLLVFLLVYIINIIILKYVYYNNLEWTIILLMFMLCIGIFKIAPMEHREKTLSSIDLASYKKIVRILVSFSFGTILFLFLHNIYNQYILYPASAIVCIYIMLILGIIKEKKLQIV